MNKEYQDRHDKLLVNPAVLAEDYHNSDHTCKECGVPIQDRDVTVCYECYSENYRRGTQ